MILSGEKKEEYRELKPYWNKRITTWECHTDRGILTRGINSTKTVEFDTIAFRLGYSKNAPTMVVECKGIMIGTPRPEWSGNMQGDHFIISLGKILKTENI